MRSGLKLFYDELGWQVDTSGHGSYAGAENVPVTTEANQAEIYGQIPRLVACDPAISAVNLFGFVDEGDRGAGFQAGLLRKDGTPRPSLNTFRDGDRGGLLAAARSPGRRRRASSAPAPSSTTRRRSRAGRRRGTPTPPRPRTLTRSLGLFKVKTPGRNKRCVGRQGNGDHKLVLEGDFEVKAGYTPLLQLRKKALASGCYVFALTLEAAMNEDRRSTYLSKAFLAGPAAKLAAKAKAKKQGQEAQEGQGQEGQAGQEVGGETLRGPAACGSPASATTHHA